MMVASLIVSLELLDNEDFGYDVCDNVVGDGDMSLY